MATGEHESSQYTKKALPMSMVRRILLRQQHRVYQVFERRFPPKPELRILDLGVSASLTRRELYFFEDLYPHKERIVAAGLEDGELFRGLFPEVEYVQVKRESRLPFEDGSFDLVFCSAVLEHVGSREEQKKFLEDVMRVGRSAFLTTPNRWFPVELHTVLPLVHYLPTPWYRRIFRLLGFDFFSREENLNLLDRRSLASLVPEGTPVEVVSHRLFGFTSNLLLLVAPHA